MVVGPKAIRRGGDARSLYVAAALAAILIVFAGFARTFYLKLVFGTPVLSLLLHVHGLVMSSWFVFFLVQAWLVSAGNVRLHRKLGVFGACLAPAVVAAGCAVAIHAVRAGHTPPGIPPLVFLIIPLGDMLIFAILVGCGLGLRRRSDFHKRLMLLASMSLLTAAITRIPIEFLQGKLVTDFSITILVALACVAWDTIRNRRLHPAFGWGALLIVVSWPLRLAVSGTRAWLDIATLLTA